MGGAQQPCVHTGERQTVVDGVHSSGIEHGVPPMPHALEPPPVPPLELEATALPPVALDAPPAPLLELRATVLLPVDAAPVPPWPEAAAPTATTLP